VSHSGNPSTACAVDTLSGNAARVNGSASYRAYGGTLTLNAIDLPSNTALVDSGALEFHDWGKSSANTGYGGNGLGGPLYISGGSVTLTGDTVSGNEAFGGPGGSYHFSAGSPGIGEGGGLYIVPTAAVILDTATLDAILNNIVASSDPNRHGPYSLS